MTRVQAQYEARQLKKAIKTADQILKKAGTHGGMLCTTVCASMANLEPMQKQFR